MKTKTISGALFCMLLFASGCGTISIRATKVDGGEKQARTLPCKFRLANYSFSTADSLDRNATYSSQLCSVPAVAGVLSQPAAEAILLKAYPDMFSTDSSALPVSVSVSVQSKSRAPSFFVSFITSLAGILPTKDIDLQDLCEVKVSAKDEENRGTEAMVRIGFCSESWFSIYTPTAMAMRGNERDFPGVSRVWKGALAFNAAEMQKAVFNETFASAVLAALRQMDENEVKRMALMRVLKSGP